ncbi:MAG: DUF58 domain-containing protein [Planctomycetia bacterium]
MANELIQPDQALAGNGKNRRRKKAFLPLGRLFSLLAAILLFIGVYKSINLLALMGYFFLFALFLNALMADRRLKQVQVRRFFPDPVFEGVPGFFLIEVQNQGLTTVPTWHLIDNFGKESVSWGVPSLKAGGNFRIQGRFLPEARGWLKMPPLERCGSYPFGLVQVRLPQDESDRVLVLPKLGNSRQSALERFLSPYSSLDDSGKVGRYHPAAQEEFHGLRNFRAGDSPRNIHWRTSARRGELMVREYEDNPGDDLLVIVDPGVGQGSCLEDLVCFAATLIYDACKVRGKRLLFALVAQEPVILEDLANPKLGLKILEALAPIHGFTSKQDYQSATGRLSSMLKEMKLPASRVLLERTEKSSILSLGASQSLPVLNSRIARERGFYEPPLKAGEVRNGL